MMIVFTIELPEYEYGDNVYDHPFVEVLDELKKKWPAMKVKAEFVKV